MTLYNEINLTSGVDDALYSLSHSVPIFPIMLLVFVFSVVLIGGSKNQQRKVGNPDVPFWSVLAGITTTLVALLMTIPPALIDITTLGIVIAVTVMCGFWYFLSSVRGEQ